MLLRLGFNSSSMLSFMRLQNIDSFLRYAVVVVAPNLDRRAFDVIKSLIVSNVGV